MQSEKKRILVVDRDVEYLTLTESRLVARDFSVETAVSSLEAFQKLDSESFSLILISSKMEPLGREALVERARKTISNCYVPIIMMAGEEDLSELIQSLEQGFDDFLIRPFDPLILQLRVLMNIRRTEERIQANPLTRLPGNIAIEKNLKEKISKGELYSVCYLDINQFKSFNDVYGYDKGDDVIRQTARIILQTARQAAKKGDLFVGHVGGDDFIVMLHPEDEPNFARACLREFDRIIPTYYSEEDRRKGFVFVKNRRGKVEKVSLMSISIAAVTNLSHKFASPAEIAQVAAEVKKYLKTQAGSNYLRDRRGRQIDRLEEACDILTSMPESPGTQEIKEPLGQFLLSAGLINAEQLDEALKTHLATGKRLGEVLISMNLVRSDEVGRMLEKKLGVPYEPLVSREFSSVLGRLFTSEYVRAHRVLPLELSDGKLRVGMLDPFDLKVIVDIERVTGHRVIPALILEAEFEDFYDRHYKKSEVI
ncbi:MAG TPA: diguanylate cyclase [Candidatus Omnitrophota bacterium]|nr:diguanylate cyclase [Candidatus Omnitrophota bacterium]